ncbi:MAG: type IV toxin-antitoxin system AbiEi family antitoxin domain-containing protein [Oscillospiraceae bacterium]|nr:type IV toxin-antitoxin system AbiEi family antitoxin domain-containing protein [Oscillospiraceae bacterium]
MNHTQQILDMAKQNNGVVTASMVDDAGLSRGVLKYLADLGKLEKTARGIYILPGTWEDEFVSLQERFKRGIFSLETALFLWNLTDRTPGKFHMTFPGTYNLSKPKAEGILCRSAKEPYYSLGITKAQTPSGNKVAVYDAERTLCDVLRQRNRVDVSVVTNAFKRYAAQKEKNIPLLSQYAKMQKVEEKLRSYLEVLL